MANIDEYVPKDSVPLPPPDAKVVTTACDYCIVGCGYRVLSWPVGARAGTARPRTPSGLICRPGRSGVGSAPTSTT